jgi:tRNA(Ile)-lysidine synthase
VNHGLRGRESDRDEAFCRALAGRLGLPFLSRHRDVAAAARAAKVSIETAARQERYEALAEMADQAGASLVATGHTRDDQAETLLLRLLRGAGAAGLSGIRPRRGRVVRPLLDIRRSELRRYLKSQRQAFREDASNRAIAIPRNWVRHRLLPMMARRFNSDIVEVLAREAAVLRDESALMDTLAEEAAALVISPEQDGGLRLERVRLLSLHPAVARRVVREGLHRAAGGRFVGADHVEAVLALAAGEADRGAADLPGARVERNGAKVVLYKRGILVRPAPGVFRYAVEVPGRTNVPECGCHLSVTRARRTARQLAALQSVRDDRSVAVIDAAAARRGLATRSRLPGDWIRPLGLRGRKKLQDVFVDRKVPRAERDRVPLVVDADDRILWVPGHIVSHEARVTDSTRSVVVLKLIRNGEEGDEA